MRILFVGSAWNQSDPSKTGAIKMAADELGYVATSRGHTILLESPTDEFIDYYVMAGAGRFCAANPGRTASPEIHKAFNSHVVLPPVPPNLTINQISYQKPIHELRNNPQLRRLGSWVGAIEACDVVITLGGGGGTTLVGNIAMDMHQTVVPVASFGGGSTALFERFHTLHWNNPDVTKRLPILTQPWQGAETAEGVIKLAESLAGTLSYFLSYSHTDHAAADHLELLLGRCRRRVIRDERELAPGDPLRKEIERLITSADVFLALWSAESAVKEWCVWERRFAARMKQSRPRPRELILIMLDDTEVGPKYSGNLYLYGRNRSEQKLAVAQLIEAEEMPGSGN